jgi:DDE superfamily endonuclease
MRCRRWVRCAEPVARDLDGKPTKNYMNRMGFFALLVQAFCGAHTNFWYFCGGWPGATNDITAYKQTSLHHNSTNKDLPTSTPKWASFLLDEAYSSVRGCHLTPHSQHQLKKALLLGEDRKTLYFKMRTFNHVLSSQRITIKRAFGQLVRRWGILWCANSSRLKNVSLIVQCCAKLHNVYVERWVKDGRRTGFTAYNEVEIIPEHVNVDIGTLPTDEDVANRLNNHYQGISERAANSDIGLH